MAHVCEPGLSIKAHSAFSWDGELRFSGEDKQDQREAVLGHFLRHGMQRLKVFSFPGPEWTFEKMVLHKRPDATFACLERRSGIIEYGIRHMPGVKKRRVKFDSPVGSLDGWVSTHAKIMCVDFCDLVRGSVRMMHKTLECSRRRADTKSKIFQSHWKLNNAIWLDGQSPVGGLLTPALARVGLFCNRNVASIPFAYTFLIGRDEPGTFDERVNAISGVLDSNRYRRFELTDGFQYHGDGCAMGTVLGLLQLRTTASTRPALSQPTPVNETLRPSETSKAKTKDIRLERRPRGLG